MTKAQIAKVAKDRERMEKWLATERVRRHHVGYTIEDARANRDAKGRYPEMIAKRENETRWRLLGVTDEKAAQKKKKKYEKALAKLESAQ